MSETESVNVLPGPHGERLWVSLEELESNEPLLEGYPGNERRAGVIKRARAELDESSHGKRDEYARVYELLGMLTPTSSHETWCKLRDELVRLRDNVAYLVGPECELVRIDTLRSIKDDSDLVSKIHGECRRFVEERESGLHDMEHRLRDMMVHVGGSKQGENVRRYIVDMARFNAVTDDRMALRVILAVYVEQGLYEEACDVCEDILRFEGDDRASMMASPLVESVIDRVLARLPGSRDQKRADGLVQRCVDLLLRRSEILGLNQRLGKGTKIQQASRLAFGVLGRRRLRTPEKVGEWIRDRYPRSYEFLNMGDKKIERMVEDSTALAEHISVHMACDEIARARHRTYVPDGALDELEHLLGIARERGIYSQERFAQWKKGIPADELWESISEMRICLRFMLKHDDVELHPKIEGGRKMDLRVDGCYVEVLTPDDGTLLLSRQAVDEAKLADRAVGKVVGKGQLGSIGDRTAAIILDCSWAIFDNSRLDDMLLDSMVDMPQLGGVFVVMFENGRYRSRFVGNPEASHALQDSTVETIRQTLETSI